MKSIVAYAACAAMLIGCAHGSNGGRAATAQEDRQDVSLARVCQSEKGAPVGIRYEDAAGGAAVLFTTPGDPTPLREQAEALARARNHYENELELQDQSELRLPHTAAVQAVEHGAKLTLVPRRPMDLDGLRRHVQQDVTQLQTHGCTGGARAL